MGTRVERLPIRLEIRLSETRPDQTLATFEWDLRAPLHIVSRMDSLYFDLVNADAQHYLHTGICRDAADRLGHLRRPVMTAVFMNVIISTVLVVATGRMAGFPYWAIIVAALCVAFLNLGSILGFADLVIERVLALSVPGPSSSN
ncbi:MAG: hypothetical protein KDB53_06200 [Planctomycetes bacterium]|nr:hypothetical protein [Planctomycetota bacterium]